MFKHFAENIFKFPRVYEFKISTLNRLNGMDTFSVEHLTKGEKVLDVGCGSYQFYYEPKNTKERVAIDVSLEMVEASKKLYPESKSIVASAEKLPFPYKGFDVITIFFVLHHIDPILWEQVLKEAARVASKSILILDHTKNKNILKSTIQRLWWFFFDSGKSYRTEEEWQKILLPYKIVEYKKKGLLFNNICYYHLKIQ